MSIHIEQLDAVSLSGTACPDDVASLNIESSYDGSNVVFRLLRLETWGPALMNLGYYRFPRAITAFNWMTNLELAQRRLVIKAISLLNVGTKSRLLDVACGRGKSSFILKCLHPDAKVTGVDLLDRHIQVARTLFDQVDNLTYLTCNAEELCFPDASVDGAMCIESAFHFPHRERFLSEACRVLRPGGRLAVVDFAWDAPTSRMYRDLPETQLVRDIWQWDDLYTIPEYHKAAEMAGFRTLATNDWSDRVLIPIQSLHEILSLVGNTEKGREFLRWRNPLYRSFSIEDWEQVALTVRAHRFVQRFTKYVAFLFEKT